MKETQHEVVLSFVLLNYNNSGYTTQCIKSIDSAVVVPHEIIVVDNASSDESLNILSKYEGIRLLKSPTNRGFTGGNNDGARIAGGKYIVILNNDTTLYNSNINELPGILASHGPWDVVGGKIVGMDGKPQTSGGYEPTLLHLLLHFAAYCYKYFPLPFVRGIWLSSWNHNQVKEVDWASGCFFAMDREKFMELGGFDENIFIYLDEVELHKRIRAMGGRIYLHPNVIIHHYGGVTWSTKNHISVKHNYNSAKYFLKKYHGWFRRIIFITFTKAASLVYLPLLFALCTLSLWKWRKLNQKFKICATLLTS